MLKTVCTQFTSSIVTRRRWFSSKVSDEISAILQLLPQRNAETQKRKPKKCDEFLQQRPSKRIYLQVIGTGARGDPASVQLFSDHTRYLINCEEGTNRLANERKVELISIKHVFLTRTNWKRLGGLLSLIWSKHSAGKSRIVLHGPPKLCDLFNAMTRFFWAPNLSVVIPQCTAGHFYEDNVLKMSYVPLHEDQKIGDKKENVQDNIDYYIDETNKKGRSLSVAPSSLTDVQHLAKSKESIVMAYICEIKPQLTTQSRERCGQHEMRSRSSTDKLIGGEDAFSANATTVYSEYPAPIFLVIDVPNRSYLNSLMKSPAFTSYQSQDEGNRLELILHFTPEHIVHSTEYGEFIAKFPLKTRHWFLNERNNSSGFQESNRLQRLRNQISDRIFPILRSEPFLRSRCNFNDDIPLKTPKSDEYPEKKILTDAQETVQTGCIRTLTKYHLLPRTGVDCSFQPDEYMADVTEYTGFAEALEEYKEREKELTAIDQAARDAEYPKIVFLGTGANGNETRNQSAILIHLTHDSSILLDCGEGTYGHIHRLYGLRAPDVFRRIKIVGITHLHADHHLGLIRVLKERKRFLGEDTTPVQLLAPPRITKFLDFYEHCIESIAKDYILLSNSELMSSPLADNRVTDHGLLSIQTCLVDHVPYAYGFALTIASSVAGPNEVIKITYSGDTKPCKSLIELGQNSTLLIHEATMKDDYEEARKKLHSTIAQAIEQGRKMDAKWCMLTHIGWDTPVLPFDSTNVCVAFDNMEIVLSDFPRLCLMHSSVDLLFSEAVDNLRRRRTARTRRKESELVPPQAT